MTNFTTNQLCEVYALQVRQGRTGDIARMDAAIGLLGPDADDDQVERLATAIGRAVEAEVRK